MQKTVYYIMWACFIPSIISAIIFAVLYGLSCNDYPTISATVNHCTLTSSFDGYQLEYSFILNVSYEGCSKQLVSAPVTSGRWYVGLCTFWRAFLETAPNCANVTSTVAYINTQDMCDSLSLTAIEHDLTLSSLLMVFGILSGIELFMMAAFGINMSQSSPYKDGTCTWC